MKRLFPKSLLGQVMAMLALGLLAAQVVSATLLYRASEERREAAIVSSLAYRLIAEAGRSQEQILARAERREARQRRRARAGERERRGSPGRPPFSGRGRIPAERGPTPPSLPAGSRSADYEAALAEVLAAQGIAAADIRVAERRAGDDAFVRALVQRLPRLRASDWEEKTIAIAAIERPASGDWITVRLAVPERRRGGLATILFRTAVILAVLVALLYLVLRRITRPLAALTTRLAEFSRAPGRAEVIAPSGPADT
ncbi:MAG: two-component sensor histidine kinase, partial [Erythrobacter sp.]